MSIRALPKEGEATTQPGETRSMLAAQYLHEPDTAFHQHTVCELTCAASFS
jgi:hypothetical protein